MAFETEPAISQVNEDSPITTTQANDNDNEEIIVPRKKTLKDYGVKVMEGLASTSIGQWIIEKTDRVLIILEQTSKWSLPQNDPEFELERPLPWLFFLTLMFWLRIIRIWLSIGGRILHYPTVTPRTMVKFIQNKRRDVRALRVHGLKTMQKRRLENHSVVILGINFAFIGKFKNLLNSVICKPGQNGEASCSHIYVEVKVDDHSANERSEQSSKRPRDEDSSDLNLTVQELLEKYAKLDSESDSDYLPKEDDDIEEDDDDDFFNEIDDSATSSMSTEEVTIEENPEISSEATLDAEESIGKNTEIKDKEIKDTEIKEDKEIKDKEIKDTEIKDTAINDTEIKTNGNTKPEEMPLKEPFSDAETCNEQMQTPAHENGSSQPAEQLNNGASETDAAPNSEVASENHSSTPNANQQKHLAAPLKDEENQNKSTPGHETAASEKLSFVGSTNENGSPQHFPSPMYPTLLGNDSTAEAQTPSPKIAERNNDDDETSPDAEVTSSGGQQKKYLLNQPNTHNSKVNYHYQSHSNAKKRNRNRR